MKELLFAVLQLIRENERPSAKYAEIIDQIFQEFLEALDGNNIEADPEVSQLQSVAKNVF